MFLGTICSDIGFEAERDSLEDKRRKAGTLPGCFGLLLLRDSRDSVVSRSRVPACRGASPRPVDADSPTAGFQRFTGDAEGSSGRAGARAVLVCGTVAPVLRVEGTGCRDGAAVAWRGDGL